MAFNRRGFREKRDMDLKILELTQDDRRKTGVFKGRSKGHVMDAFFERFVAQDMTDAAAQTPMRSERDEDPAFLFH